MFALNNMPRGVGYRLWVIPFVAYGLVSCAPASAQTYPVPPPPVPALEIWTPTFNTYSVSSRCQKSHVRMEWAYDGTKSAVQSFSLNEHVASQTKLDEVNEALASMAGEILARVSCANDVAIVYFISEGGSFKSGAKRIRYDWVDGDFREIRRYNF